MVRAAEAYGDQNKANGVTVGFVDLGKSGENGVTPSTLGSDANGNLFAQSDVTINSRSTGTDSAAAVGHEGSHVADAQDMAKSITITDAGRGLYTLGTDISQYASEQRAYLISEVETKRRQVSTCKLLSSMEMGSSGLCGERDPYSAIF